jgi:hypothetical protein
MTRRRRLDPFEPDITIEERQTRAPGYLVKLKREHGGQTWDEELTLTGISTFDEASGIVTLFALTGRPPRDFDPYRESGQFRTISTAEIQTTKGVTTRTTRARKGPVTRSKSTKSFVAYAEEIMRKGKPMHVKDITAAAQEAGLTTNGATSAVTMGARLGAASDRFTKLGKGMFELK